MSRLDSIQQLMNGAFLSFDEEFHSAVPAVPDGPFHREVLRKARYRGPETDALDRAGVDNTQPLPHAGTSEMGNLPLASHDPSPNLPLWTRKEQCFA